MKFLHAMLRRPSLLLTSTLALAGFAQPADAVDPVRTWNEQALTTVREKNAIDAAAARLYAMVNIAMYDAVNGIESRHDHKDDRAWAIVDPSNAPADGDTTAAAIAAA